MKGRLEFAQVIADLAEKADPVSSHVSNILFALAGAIAMHAEIELSAAVNQWVTDRALPALEQYEAERFKDAEKARQN